MKLYLVETRNDVHPEILRVWVGSQSDAAGERKSLLARGFKRADTVTKEIDVPTDKKGLLAFLNAVQITAPDQETSDEDS